MVLNKKALKLVVCMSLIAALAFTAIGITVAAMYENTHDNTGDQASDIVSIAETQVGYGEGYDGYTKYGDWYGLPYSDWCAMFVSWCANQAGVDTSTFPSFALCSAGADWFISQGEFQYSGSYAPKAGDLIFYSSYGDIYHVGLVTGSDDYNVYSIEGNYNEAVYNVSYPLSYGDILGYATPAYSTADGTVVTPVVDNDDSDTYVEEDSEEEYISDDDSEEVVYTDDEEEYTYDEEETDVNSYVEDEEETDTEVYVENNDDEEEDEEDSEAVTVDTEEDKSTDSDENTTDDVEFVLGDVNGDGRVSALDALLIQRYLALDTGDYEFSFVRADVNQDGEITIIDALMILEIVTGLA